MSDEPPAPQPILRAPDSVRKRLKRRGSGLPLLAELRRIRVDRNIPQIALALRMGFTPRQLVRWECGTAQPGIMTVIAWAEALGCGLVLVRRDS